MFDLQSHTSCQKTVKGDKTPAISQQARKLNKTLKAFARLETAGWNQIPFSRAVWVQVLLNVIYAASHLQERWLLVLHVQASPSTQGEHREVVGAETKVNSSPSSPIRLTKPQAISVLLLGEMENRGQGERTTVVRNGRLNSWWGQQKAHLI